MATSDNDKRQALDKTFVLPRQLSDFSVRFVRREPEEDVAATVQEQVIQGQRWIDTIRRRAGDRSAPPPRPRSVWSSPAFYTSLLFAAGWILFLAWCLIRK